jgi:hypothetical protein
LAPLFLRLDFLRAFLGAGAGVGISISGSIQPPRPRGRSLRIDVRRA